MLAWASLAGTSVDFMTPPRLLRRLSLPNSSDNIYGSAHLAPSPGAGAGPARQQLVSSTAQRALSHLGHRPVTPAAHEMSWLPGDCLPIVALAAA